MMNIKPAAHSQTQAAAGILQGPTESRVGARQADGDSVFPYKA